MRGQVSHGIGVGTGWSGSANSVECSPGLSKFLTVMLDPHKIKYRRGEKTELSLCTVTRDAQM